MTPDDTPTLDDLPAGVIRTDDDARVWAGTSLDTQRWIIREAQRILDEYGPHNLYSIGGLLVAGG